MRRIEQGEAAEAVCRSVNISEATLYRWKQRYGAMELDEVKELKALRDEKHASEATGRRSGPENPSAEGGELKKMVSPSQRHHAVRSVVAAGMCSSRQACRYLGLARSSLAYRRKPPGERRVQTEAMIVELARKHPRYGYRSRLHSTLGFTSPLDYESNLN